MSSVDAREVKVAIAHDACGGGCGGGGGGAVEVRARRRAVTAQTLLNVGRPRAGGGSAARRRAFSCVICARAFTRELGALLSFVRWVAREVRAER
jgi:hypothetical protein